nr:hypothetical protein [Mesorhizobium sp.]
MASAPKTKASKNIITLKVTLRGTKPPVWRRLVMPGTMTLGDLHQAIQAAMGWHDGPPPCLRHRRRAVWRSAQCRRRRRRKSRDPERPAEITSATIGSTRSHSKKASRSSRAYPTPSASLESATVHQRIAAASGAMRSCWPFWPIPPNPEHAERSDWIGEEFNPDEFDLEHANTVLAARFTKK